MARLRAGILGCGRISERHVAAMKALPDEVELVACASRSFATAEAFAGRHGGMPHDSFQRMLDQARLDALIVAIPPAAHAGEVEAAAAAGIHMVLEKPIALDNDRASSMVDAAWASRIVTQVSFIQRFGGAVENWIALQQSGQTGPIGLMTGCFYVNAPHGKWWTQRATSGGQTLEQLIHIVDLVRLFMGEPDTVFGRTANMFHQGQPGYDIEDMTTAVFGYNDGRTAVLTATDAIAEGLRMKEWRLIAEKYSAQFSNENRATFSAIGEDAAAVERIASEQDVFVSLMADFLAAIRQKRPARVPIEEGARSLALALAARQAGDGRCEIRLH